MDISFTVCLFYVVVIWCVFVCMVTDFSAEDKASSVKFCVAVHRRPGQGISHLGNFAPPEAQIGRISLCVKDDECSSW